MKTNKLLSLAAAAMLLTACADETVLTPQETRDASPESNAISFGAYSGRSGMTRAGATGSYDTNFLKGGEYGNNDLTTSWTAAKAAQQGFGVFGYYTGKQGYGARTSYTEKTDGTSGQSMLAANFMFNQLVKWNNALRNDYVTKWEYTPVKYWPNEVQEGANGVDDQDNDTSTDPATTSYTKGGNVTFFAYAPYVDFGEGDVTGIGYTSATDGSNQGTKGGIVAINGETVMNNANSQQSDPILTYIVPTNADKMVDLLWGTYGGTSLNVKNGGNVGVTGNSAESASDADANYVKSILDGYTVNANLTKQKTNGTVGFAFKHALAKVGGSTVPLSGAGDLKNGLLVVLDIDDMKGAEIGGSKEDVTRVSITDISITARSLVAADGGTKTIGTTEVKYLKSQQGKLNLATGQWEVVKGIEADGDNVTDVQSEAGKTVHNIVTKTDGVSTLTASAKLADAIEEKVNPGTAGNETNWNIIYAVSGVTTTPQNVYGEETNPLVFIPNTYPELTITVNYTVRTKDNDHLANYYSEVTQSITKKLTFQEVVKLNKQYSIVMHLGLTSVKFTAEVSDWEVNGDTDGDGIIEGTEKVEVEDVYIPRNVAGLMISYPATLTSAAVAAFAPTSETLYYYEDGTRKDVSSDLAYVTPPTGADDWVSTLTTTTGAINIKANDGYDSRTATFQIKYAPTGGVTIYSDNITLTQLGKIPTDVAITWKTDPELSTEKEKATGDVSFEINEGKVSVNGKESDNITSFNQPGVDLEKLIFIDDATGNVAEWITEKSGFTVSSGTWTVAANPSTTNRSATLYAVVKGKRVIVKKSDTPVKLTQKGN